MKKSATWGVVVALAGVMILAGGLATASNMGFKFVPSVGANQSFNLSLPWNNNYTDAKTLLDDMPNIVRVTRFNPDSTLTDWFVGADPSAKYPIVKGSAYIATAGGSASTTAVVVGSHDPNFTFNFVAGQAYNAAAPYHQTLTNAKGLLDNINAFQAGSVGRVTKFEANGTLTDWFVGADPASNFALTLGMGVIIYPDANVNGYVWPHY